MVNTQRTWNREQINEAPEERIEIPQGNPPPERNQEDGDRMGQVEQNLEHIVTFMQGTQPTQPTG